jgi:hypothetical protein
MVGFHHEGCVVWSVSSFQVMETAIRKHERDEIIDRKTVAQLTTDNHSFDYGHGRYNLANIGNG